MSSSGTVRADRAVLIVSRIKDMQAVDHAARNADFSFLVLVIGACVGSERPVCSEIDSFFRSCAARIASKQFAVSSEHQLQWCFARLALIVSEGAQLLHNQFKLHDTDDKLSVSECVGVRNIPHNM